VNLDTLAARRASPDRAKGWRPRLSCGNVRQPDARREGDVVEAIGLGAVVLVGASAQRVTGLGFSLVSSPFMVLLLGPFDGVLVINACGAVTSLVVLTQVWRDVDLRRAALLIGPALPAVVAGAWLARSLPAPPLAVVVGLLILVALVAVVASERARVLRGTTGAVIAGVGSGFLNVTVGAGGPAVAVYAVSIGWAQRNFAATAQLVFAALGVASLLAKGDRPAMATAGWIMVGAGLLAGIAAGNHLAERVSPERARLAVIILAMAGAVLTVVKGAIEL
jgi:uncharacterized membrane protein YfcA